MKQLHSAELAATLRELARSIVREIPDSSLSRTAAGTLSVLERLGPQRITTLAEHEAVSQPAMTGLVQRLEASGLVTRAGDPDDRRAALITITEIGSKELSARRLGQDEAIVARMDLLSPYDRALLAAAAPAISSLTRTHVL